MRNLTPHFVLDKMKAKEHRGSQPASVLSIDLRGFTALTQDLMHQTESGAELLSDVINAIFTPAIAAVENRGGFISGFAGDAFTAIFSGEHGASQAISAAQAIRDFFIASGLQKTEFGDYEVSARLGLAKGVVRWTIIPDRLQSVYWFCGEGIDLAVQAEKRAEPNQIVLQNSIATGLDRKALQTTKLDQQFSILSLSKLPDSIIKTPARRLSQKAFVPAQILELKQEGEFREVLSCFINLADPQDWQSKAIISLCATYGAYFNKVDCTDKGWVALVLFGAPIAYEKTGLRALQFSHELHSQIGAGIRIGLSWGKAYAGFIGSQTRGEYTALGMAVNLGARFMHKAQWGEIWFDRPILKETQQNISYEDLGDLQFKGFDLPISAYKLGGFTASVATSLHQTSFVGRAEELRQLTLSCSALSAGKFAGVTYIYGEAGQGKSRLVYELQQTLGDTVQYHYLQCDSILRGALNPFIYWIRNEFTSKETGNALERRADFRQHWAEFVTELQTRPEIDKSLTELNRTESVIAGLIGLEWEGSIFASLSPKERLSATQFALKSLIESYCLLRPVVLILEDLHWIDSESSTALQIITRKATNIPFKLIVTSRYYDDQTKPVLSLDPDVQVDSIDLGGWDLKTMKEYVSDILQAPAAEELSRNLYAQAQGNPFYTEQICLYLLETEQLALKEGQYHQKQAQLSLPFGIHGLLVARLDRLEGDLKQTVQTASILGREFALNILHELLIQIKSKAGEADILQEQIQTGEQERIWNTISKISYIFSHSLLRDSAYQMQLKKNLRKLHLIAAKAMEKLCLDDKTQYAEIATHYDHAGNWQKALKFYKKAGDHERDLYHFTASLQHYGSGLALNQKHRAERHPDTATSLFDIGYVHYTKSEYDQALKYYAEALSIRQELLGEKHADTAKSLSGFGSIHVDKGEYDKAIEYYEQALAAQQEVWGEKHQDTAMTLNNLGGAYYKKGEYDSALQYHERSLSIRKEVLGARHADTASSLNNIGSLYNTKGEYDKALEYLEQALPIWRETLGERHPNTALCLNNIGLIHVEKGEYGTALEYYAEALAIQQEVFGERHPNTALTLNNLGNVCLNKSEDSKALQYYERSLAIWREVFGERHPYVALSLNNIGIIYINKGDNDTGLRYIEQALPVMREIMGEKHPETARMINNIGCIYALKGEDDKALGYLEQALAIRREALGERHRDTADSLHQIGISYSDKGEYDKAFQYYEEALSIRQEALGERHPDTADSLSNIGTNYLKQRENDKALECFELALAIRQEALGEQHADTASSYSHIGVIYERKDQNDKALEYFEQALSIRQELFGAGHPLTIETLNNLVETYDKLGKPEKAAEYRARAEQKADET